MPEMLSPSNTAYLPIPATQTTVPTVPRPQPPQPRDPFRRVPGPPVFILPHEGEPARLERDNAPVRLAAVQAPPGGLVSRGTMYTSSQFLPAVPPTLPPVEEPVPTPETGLKARLRAAWKKKRQWAERIPT
jgi:hypothetical protein